jgi:hypothetical protein
MIKKLLILIVLVVVGVLALASFQPDQFTVSRTGLIDGSPASVFPKINNFRSWQEWSPWAKIDPSAKSIFSGPEAGVGASFRWESADFQVGVGSMTIVESRADELVRIRLDFEEPFAGTNLAELSLQPEGEKTRMTWSMTGENSMVGKIMGLFMDCEKMVGDYFEQGFRNLSGAVYSATAAPTL